MKKEYKEIYDKFIKNYKSEFDRYMKEHSMKIKGYLNSSDRENEKETLYKIMTVTRKEIDDRYIAFCFADVPCIADNRTNVLYTIKKNKNGEVRVKDRTTSYTLKGYGEIGITTQASMNRDELTIKKHQLILFLKKPKLFHYWWYMNQKAKVLNNNWYKREINHTTKIPWLNIPEVLEVVKPEDNKIHRDFDVKGIDIKAKESKQLEEIIGTVFNKFRYKYIDDSVKKEVREQICINVLKSLYPDRVTDYRKLL